MHRGEGRLDACLRDLAEALRRGPEPWIHRLRAECLDKLGRMEEALAAADAGLALAPRDAALHALRGHCLLRRKRYSEADAAYTRGLRAAPRSATLLADRSDCRWLMGRHAAAALDARRAAEAEPGSFARQLNLARLQVLTGRDGGAVRVLEEWRRSGDPERDAGASFWLGARRFRRGEYAEAAREFARAEALARRGHFPGRFVDAGYSVMAKGFEFMSRHRKTDGKPRAGATLLLTGLGLDYPRQATLETLQALTECDIVVNNLAGAEGMDFLRLFCKDVRTISFEGDDALHWADRVFQWIKPGRTVAFVTRGHPLVSGHLALELITRARREGLELRCYGALSSVDQMLALTQEVLAETYWGAQVLDSRLLSGGRGGAGRSCELQTTIPVLLYLNTRKGTAHRRGILRLCALLRETYGRAHPARVFGPRYDTRDLREVPVGELEPFLLAVEPRMISSLILLLPPLPDPRPARAFRAP